MRLRSYNPNAKNIISQKEYRIEKGVICVKKVCHSKFFQKPKYTAINNEAYNRKISPKTKIIFLKFCVLDIMLIVAEIV